MNDFWVGRWMKEDEIVNYIAEKLPASTLKLPAFTRISDVSRGSLLWLDRL